MNDFFFLLLAPVFLVSLLVSLLATAVVKKVAHRFQILDKPNARKIHTEAIPTIGGVAIFLGFVLAIVSHLEMNQTLLAILGGSTLIVALGLMDDLWGMPASVKLIGQFLVAALTHQMGIQVSFLSNPLTQEMVAVHWLSFPITVIWIVAIMNTVNLIDGIDGLAGGVVAISAFFLTIVALMNGQYVMAVITVAILGSCLGFLKYNFPPAQIFMGDSGAMFLGYVLALASILGVFKTTITLSLAIPIFVLGLPITDTIYAICRRIKNKKALFIADTDHIHHRLVQKGLTHKQVAAFLYTISIVLGVLGVLMSFLSGGKAIIVFGIAVCFIIFVYVLIRRKRDVIFNFFQLFF
ncbi:undecaprenyl/decaprenyl-phosphate alpha-N-acetylglucosaminyl 1-phosphate transferase [bacterium]|jgi:UDP-GlcNAc:undecaprenyl-phosphate/decaprenyl-phosphate GlcNAc-1-phosphate transferase|nr:undecaprenyl/decaprenyl-phosphate alpha-N-acetylglucosaminyl 1-phosphate transferase [bacterium]